MSSVRTQCKGRRYRCGLLYAAPKVIVVMDDRHHLMAFDWEGPGAGGGWRLASATTPLLCVIVPFFDHMDQIARARCCRSPQGDVHNTVTPNIPCPPHTAGTVLAGQDVHAQSHPPLCSRIPARSCPHKRAGFERVLAVHPLRCAKNRAAVPPWHLDKVTARRTSKTRHSHIYIYAIYIYIDISPAAPHQPLQRRFQRTSLVMPGVPQAPSC